MARDRTGRTRVCQLLATQGPVADSSGYATSVLKDAVAYQGSAVAFIQLIAAMERDGEIVREIRGKRTYRIAASESTLAAHADATPAPAAAPAARPSLRLPDFPDVEVDYERLARALVRELWTAAQTSGAPGDLERAAEARALREERDDYARRLEAARRNLDELLADAARQPAAHARRS